MERATTKNGMYACIAAALIFFACSKDTLFDPNGHAFSYPFAFVSLTLPNALSLSDTLGLATADTVPKGRNIYFIGLVSNPQLKVNKAWIFGDGQREDTASIAMHAFSQSGLYHAYYSIWDQEGNVLSDSVMVRVVTVPVVDILYIPLTGDTGVGPAGIEFAWHKVPADSGDTVLSFLLLGTSRSSLDTVGRNIKGQSYSLTDTLLSSTTYYWRVVLKSSFGQIDSSVVDSFTTGIQTVLSKPIILSTLRDTTVKVGDALNFYAQVMDSGSTIAEYAWDFDGNGVYDFINTATDSCAHSYPLAGTYKAVLRVTDKNGINAYDTVTITITALQPTPGTPVIVKIKNDTTVKVGDTVKFYATVYDSSSTIAKFEWDFNGDGTFDTVKTDTSLCSHVYQTAGTYRAVLRVTDANGKTATATAKIIVVPIIQTDTPVVQSISHDTTVTVLDPVLLFARVTDVAGDTITLYSWHFGDGTNDTAGIHADSVIHRFPTAGLFNVVFRATDKAGLYAQDTVKITVVRQKLLQLNFSSRDTIVDFGGTVRCSINVTTPLSNLSFAIDTAHSGSYIPMKQSGASASYNFSTGTASSWDSVKMRATSPSSDTLFAGFKVEIRPRPLTITGIDSTDSTITVTWSQTMETDFQEYLLYRNSTSSVDTTGELVATITQAGTLTYTTPVPSYVPQPRYYRVYQKDKEGLLSAGSNIVFGAIRNSPPGQPVFIVPLNDNDSLLSNATIRWKRSIDPNGDTVRYELQLNKNNAGYVSYASGITDTFIVLHGIDTTGFIANIKIIASDTKGASSSAERLNIKFKNVASGIMRRVLAGTITDDQGNTALISHDFFMDTTEVTQLSYSGVMPSMPNQGNGNVGNQFPVENVSWFDAIMFCNALSKRANLDTVYAYTGNNANTVVCTWTKNGYRLATEDEWELAAKAGENLMYATNDGLLSCAEANYGGCHGGTTLVANYLPNSYGLHDLTGNVSEWCWDRYQLNPPGRTNGRTDYTGPIATAGVGSQAHSMRGGSYLDNNTTILESSYRSSSAVAAPSIGFRCVRLAQ